MVLICLLQVTVGLGDTSHLESPSPAGQTSTASLSSRPTLPCLPTVPRALTEAGSAVCLWPLGVKAQVLSANPCVAFVVTEGSRKDLGAGKKKKP